MIVNDIRPLVAPLISILCAVLILWRGDNTFLRRLFSISAAIIKWIIVFSMLPGSLAGKIYVTELIPFTPGISFLLRVDGLGMFFGMISSTLWIITTVYAIGYMEGEHARKRFFAFFALCVSTTIGIAFAGNLFTLFVFYEMLTVCTYPLILHDETPEAMKAGRKYLIYTLTGGSFILFATAMTFYSAGTVTFSEPGILSISTGVGLLAAIFAMFMLGFGVKAAIMPLHGWLPSAMVAPTPVSALLHAVAVVKAGVFGITRIIYNIFGVSLLKEMALKGMPVAEFLMWAAMITIICASLMALMQDNLKKRLAYSTISQLSYIVLGVSLLTPNGALGGIVHIANQAFMKITMFFAAGAIYKKTHKKNISEMHGIGHKMPLTMATFTIASLGMMGLPPTAGFISKWYLCLGALDAGKMVVVVVLLVSSFLNAAYFLPIVYRAYFMKPQDGNLKTDEAHWTLLAPCVICALYTIGLGLFADLPFVPLALARGAVMQFFGV
ncbi:monovalent cation/H+ antiporter subunit D family protein [Candidatus Oleimmundimicrobium sp.]|uniref:monovalent cation/H+ antiporter subunit D family protein n=1 Tax=Candidatus Oleimmundimicrobium sp. TaxID=3060597 RepID=UPI002728B881|nr:monovalent cation/H+ antiporter subunit D family protein [Candidatus Oleimmundimicrobium sp.]MDO8885887.1 monovalent cation/H+ antiporter subunit D family protein [Candidatus Oleimmundimicrobium sp.]